MLFIIVLEGLYSVCVISVFVVLRYCHIVMVMLMHVLVSLADTRVTIPFI